jgi:hypothetical protein
MLVSVLSCAKSNAIPSVSVTNVRYATSSARRFSHLLDRVAFDPILDKSAQLQHKHSQTPSPELYSKLAEALLFPKLAGVIIGTLTSGYLIMTVRRKMLFPSVGLVLVASDCFTVAYNSSVRRYYQLLISSKQGFNSKAGARPELLFDSTILKTVVTAILDVMAYANYEPSGSI